MFLLMFLLSLVEFAVAVAVAVDVTVAVAVAVEKDRQHEVRGCKLPHIVTIRMWKSATAVPRTARQQHHHAHTPTIPTP
jgi:hypothetical protein